MKRIKYVANIAPDRLQAFQQEILAWYRANGRDLPWRRRADPYAVIVSEIMLHQTTVTTVQPVFAHFIETFPTVQDLYQARLEEVKAITDPLGYKIRGSWLKGIASYVVEQCQGQWPDTVEGWMALPGVGRYTAGAVLSLAFGQDVPILDTNVKRVLGRYFGLEYRGTQAETLHHLWALADAVVPEGQGLHFNQALMDFGALVCTARKPLCTVCPLVNVCLGASEALGTSAAEESFIYEISPRQPEQDTGT